MLLVRCLKIIDPFSPYNPDDNRIAELLQKEIDKLEFQLDAKFISATGGITEEIPIEGETAGGLVNFAVNHKKAVKFYVFFK